MSVAERRGPALPEPQALYLASPDGPLAAWLHRPVGPVRQAVLLCGPFGREEVSAYRAWRSLALALAAQGHCVLRFDYAGCGDSCGDEQLPDLIGAWTRSVHAAADALSRLSGQAQVVMAGLRLGGLLAMEAAAARTDVASLVVIAPTLTGRGYLRELRAMQAAAPPAATGDAPYDGMSSGGFELPAIAVQALEALDWRKPTRAPAARMLILDRADMPSLEKWAEALGSLGVVTRREVLAGFGELMLDPHHAEVPESMWQAVIAEVNALPGVAVVSAESLDLGEAQACFGSVEERAVRLPQDGVYLQGVHSRPLAQAASGRLVLMLNAGATRRIGPSRSYVTVARRLAGQGHHVVRVDLSGLGDSPAQPGAEDSVVYTPTAVAEVAEVVNALKQWPGIRSVQVMGLCAGAYHAFKAAARGAPVSAVLAINPLTFFWHAELPLDMPLRPHQVIGEMDRYREGMYSAARWRKLLRGDVKVGHVAAVVTKWLGAYLSKRLVELARTLRWPLKDDLARELDDVASRGIRLDFIFAQDEPGRALLHDQGGRAVHRLVSQHRLAMHEVPGADHVFTQRGPRQRFIELATQLLTRDDRLPP